MNTGAQALPTAGHSSRGQTVVLPRILEIGGGVRHRLAAVLERLGCKRPLLITDATMQRLGVAQALLDAMPGGGAGIAIHALAAGEPSESMLQPGLALLGAGDCDSLIALGGGSVIDAAKALSVLAVHRGKVMRDLAHPAVIDAPGLPLIAIPTTAGTGSEVTRVTIITDDTPGAYACKMLCVGLGFLPVAALVDYELTLALPQRMTADTGIDAITHAIEAYVSRRAGAFSDHCALGALQRLAPNLRRAYRDGQDRAAREATMFGATLAGMAFSNASVALVHGMSRPIGAHFHVPHGLSNAMLLPAVTAFSLDAARDRYADCARAMGLGDVDALVPWLRALNRDLAVPGMADFGIDAERFHAVLPIMAEQALASGSPGNNPRLASADDIIALYRTIWNEQPQAAGQESP